MLAELQEMAERASYKPDLTIDVQNFEIIEEKNAMLR